MFVDLRLCNLSGAVGGDLVEVFLHMEEVPIIVAVKVIEAAVHSVERLVVCGYALAWTHSAEMYLLAIDASDCAVRSAAKYYGACDASRHAAHVRKSRNALINQVGAAIFSRRFANHRTPVTRQKLLEFAHKLWVMQRQVCRHYQRRAVV